MHNYQNTDKIIPEKNPDNPKIYWRRLPIWRFFWYYVQATILDIFLKCFYKTHANSTGNMHSVAESFFCPSSSSSSSPPGNRIAEVCTLSPSTSSSSS